MQNSIWKQQLSSAKNLLKQPIRTIFLKCTLLACFGLFNFFLFQINYMWFSRENCFHLSYLKHREIHVWQTLDFLGTLETAQTKKAENNHSGGGGGGGGRRMSVLRILRDCVQIRTILRAKIKQAIFLAVVNFSYTMLLPFDTVFINNVGQKK